MRFMLMSAKKFHSKNTGSDYYKAIVFDYDADVLSNIFIDEKTFSYLNENDLCTMPVDNFIRFKYDIDKQAYRPCFDINK
jgi:hypothetical protein